MLECAGSICKYDREVFKIRLKAQEMIKIASTMYGYLETLKNCLRGAKSRLFL